MKMDLVYTIEDSVIKGKLVADKGGKDFDGHLEVEVSGETIGVADVYNVMKELESDVCIVKVINPKTFQIMFVKKEFVETLFNGVVCLFENFYALSEY